MTYCCCITCELDKARANAAPGRRNLRPLFSPVVVTRDTATGATSTTLRLLNTATHALLASPVAQMEDM